MTKTKIRQIDNDWKYVKNVCRNTDNKEHTKKEPTSKFKLALLISEHSPIREIKVKWFWEGIKSWISVHFARHRYECYVSTQRTDRTGVNRDESSQDTPVNMDNSANAQHLIDLARKRLCECSAPETVLQMEDLKIEIHEAGEVELSNVLVPNCVYRLGCPEFKKCGKIQKLIKKNPSVMSIDIQERYDAYNQEFWSEKGLK